MVLNIPHRKAGSFPPDTGYGGIFRPKPLSPVVGRAHPPHISQPETTSRIDKELDKFRNIIPAGGSITKELVEEYIGISREYNGFELANALWERNLNKAYEIIRYFSTNPKNYPNPII